MSYFGAKLEELLAKTGTTAAEIARVTGISEGLISRYTCRRQKFVSHENLKALTTVISKNRIDKAELIQAHLLDECVGQGSELITIEIKGERMKEDTTPYRTELPLKLQQELEAIGHAAITDPDVRSIVSTVARISKKQAQG